MKSQALKILMKTLAEVAKAQGVNTLAEAAGGNRKRLYKTLKGGSKTRYEVIQTQMLALGVELAVLAIAIKKTPLVTSKPGSHTIPVPIRASCFRGVVTAPGKAVCC